MSEFSIDLSSYKYRTQVTEDEYRESLVGINDMPI